MNTPLFKCGFYSIHVSEKNSPFRLVYDDGQKKDEWMHQTELAATRSMAQKIERDRWSLIEQHGRLQGSICRVKEALTDMGVTL